MLLKVSESREKLIMKITDKECFTFIKGIAIISMIIHHAFGFPAWYVDGISYPDIFPYAEYIRNSARLCIPIFVFLTGGGYYLHQNKSFKYSVKKILSFYISYWIAFLVLLALAYLCGNRLTAKSILLELLGTENILMKFCWYVPFYALLMLVLPLYAKILGRKWYTDVAVTGIIYFIFRIGNIVFSGTELSNLFNDLSVYFPVLSVGFLFVKYDILDRIRLTIQRTCPSCGVQTAIGLLFVGGAFAVNAVQPFVKGISTGAVLVPMLILGVSLLCRKKNGKVQLVGIVLGKYSMNIWFLHCAFFSIYTNLTLQPIAYFPRVPVLVVVWILLMCMLVAIPIKKAQTSALKIVDRLVDFTGKT